MGRRKPGTVFPLEPSFPRQSRSHPPSRGAALSPALSPLRKGTNTVTASGSMEVFALLQRAIAGARRVTALCLKSAGVPNAVPKAVLYRGGQVQHSTHWTLFIPPRTGVRGPPPKGDGEKKTPELSPLVRKEVPKGGNPGFLLEHKPAVAPATQRVLQQCKRLPSPVPPRHQRSQQRNDRIQVHLDKQAALDLLKRRQIRRIKLRVVRDLALPGKK